MPPRLALQFTPLRTLSSRGSRHLQIHRAFHDAKADFITFDSRGSLTTQKVDIFIGEPHEAYIIFNKDISLAIRSAVSNQTGICLASDSEKIPLVFFHDSLHFAHAAIPYPRIVIKRNLPRQNTSNTSPATLWLWGASHSITLDGTADHMFEESSWESHKRLRALQNFCGIDDIRGLKRSALEEQRQAARTIWAT